MFTHPLSPVQIHRLPIVSNLARLSIITSTVSNEN